jgi:NAD(P)-dependent dehydrogenase (short-subunit alcohol dehydrogenase family)
MEILDLTGKVVIVTGASSGIGEATARALYEAGAQPVLAARRADRLASLSEQLGGALAVPTDVRYPDAREWLVQETLNRHGRIDGLVNNAGAALYAMLAELDLTAFSELLQLNVVSALGMMQAVLPAMRSQGAGRIVNVSSGTTRMAPPTVGGYAAAKAALNMLGEVARKEWAMENIVVSTVLPSLTATEFGGGIYRLGEEVIPGFFVQSADYVGRIIVRALRTGEEAIDIPHGAEQPELTEVPAG